MGKDRTRPPLRVIKTDGGSPENAANPPAGQRRQYEGPDVPLEQINACPTCGSKAGNSQRRMDNWLFCGQARVVGRVGTNIISGLFELPVAANDDLA